MSLIERPSRSSPDHSRALLDAPCRTSHRATVCFLYTFSHGPHLRRLCNDGFGTWVGVEWEWVEKRWQGIVTLVTLINWICIRTQGTKGRRGELRFCQLIRFPVSRKSASWRALVPLLRMYLITHPLHLSRTCLELGLTGIFVPSKSSDVSNLFQHSL